MPFAARKEKGVADQDSEKQKDSGQDSLLSAEWPAGMVKAQPILAFDLLTCWNG